ncbi:MAG: ABC transporter ATP-binding protein [Lachnospiraceae bacterium]|nr:ABC transporter ATP-binding protein [Lachnospiraceae bacterium]
MKKSENLYFLTEALTVGYNGIPLIKNIRIQLRRGEILTLIGPNGAGKTTILKSIIRQISPVAGVVYLEGENMEFIRPSALSEKMSVMLTDRVRSEMMNCEDIVATGRYPYTGKFGVMSEHDRQIVLETMELVHISDLAKHDFEKISDGQRQRVMLARALCQEPDLLILDEPTSFLDIKYKLEFLSVLQKMARDRNLSVIMSMHELDLAERISDRIACLRGDRIDRFGTPEEIFTGGYIPELYDMTVGSFEERTGHLELEAVRGEPQVFVIAGCGTGTPVFRRLQREAVPFAAGILYENDLDFPSARALAAEVISVRPFTHVDDGTYEQAREMVNRCEKVICTLQTEKLGRQGDALRRLYREAESAGKLSETE